MALSEATLRKHAKELMALYKKLYAEHLRTDPELNSYTDIWGFHHMADDLTKAGAAEVIEYYFDNKNYFNQNLKELFNNYVKYAKTIKERKEDAALVAELKKQSAERVKNWLDKQSN